ncbi:MAG: hypothetical protein AB7E47_05870 [Desulfovibrionaceae bacterium]
MSEYTEHLGRRVELRRVRLQKEAELIALRDNIRRLLDPIADIKDLPGDLVAAQALALANQLIELAEIDAKLAAIAAVIGKE